MEQSTGYNLLTTRAAFGAVGGTSARLAFESALVGSRGGLCMQV